MGSGGAERVAATLANSWVDRGYTVKIVVTYSGRGGCFYLLSDQVHLVYLADLIGPSRTKLHAYMLRLLALRRIIREEAPDVVLSFLTNVNVAVVLAAVGLGFPLILAERTYPPLSDVGWGWGLLRRGTYPFAEQVVMLSGEGLVWLNDRIPCARGVVIPNPVPYPIADVAPCLKPNEFVTDVQHLLLAVGRLDSGKQFNLLLDAFAVLAWRHPSWELAILGEGPERVQLVEQVQRLGLSGRVHLPGRAGNVGEWYSRADLYVMSSRFEGFPNTLAEAMAYGCAAVSYDCDTGPRDIIRHELDGLLVSPVGDVAALTLALDRLMGNADERDGMGIRAQEIRVRYSLSAVLGKWDDVFQFVGAMN